MKLKIINFKYFKYIILISFIFIFIVFYIRYLLLLYAGKYVYLMRIPTVLFIGFAIIIVGIFYFFFDLNNSNKSNKIILDFKILNENLIKVFLILLMSISAIIPPIKFTQTVMDWNQIGFFNYFRAISFLIGCSFLPGANIFKIFFPKSILHKKFKVEPYFLKITIYPLMSFTFLGTCSLILDFIGLIREFFMPVLFLIIIILLIIDFVIQKHRNNNNFQFRLTEIKVSKYSFLILFITSGIIIIALGIHLSAKYLIPGDSWRGIAYAYSIGNTDSGSINEFYSYEIYWGHISNSLHILSGIPVININALLFPFLFLFITTIYLFIKAILIDYKENYSILATIFVVTFSGLFFTFNTNMRRENVSNLIFDGILCFRYKGFATFLVIMAMALFLIIAKTSKDLEKKSILKTEDLLFIILGAWFLIQSFIIYFFIIIPAISLIILYYLFSYNKIEISRILLIFWKFFIIFFIIIDLFASFFLSQMITAIFLDLFFGINAYFLKEILFFNAIFIYSLFISLLLLFLLINMIFIKIVFNFKRKNFKFKIKPKIYFLIFTIIFSVFLIIDILNNLGVLRRNLKIEQNFLLFYLDLLFLNIGFIGILGIFLFYFTFKKNRNLFFILLGWFLIIFCMALTLIIITWLKYPFINPQQIPYTDFYFMMFWFDRNWCYSIIPLSIFSSIGLLKLMKYLKSKNFLKIHNKYLSIFPNLFVASTIIYLSLTNTIISGIWWNNIDWVISDDEAQIIGWVSENVPRNSKILIDRRGHFKHSLYDASFSTAMFIDDIIEKAFSDGDNDRRYLTTIFNYLKLNNFKYYIYSKENTIHKSETEKYIDIENELITIFYNKKLYEYGDFIIYSR